MPSPVHLPPPSPSCSLVSGYEVSFLTIHQALEYEQSPSMFCTYSIPTGHQVLYPMTRASSLPKTKRTVEDNSIGFRVRPGVEF